MRQMAAAAIVLWAAPLLVAGQPLFDGRDPFSDWFEPATEPRVVPPGPERQSEERARIERLLAGRLGRDEPGVFHKLRELAIETTENPDARYVLLQMAIEAGLAAGDLSGALRLADIVAEEYAVDGPVVLAGLLRRSLEHPSATDTQPGTVVGAEFRGVIETLLVADRAELAGELLAMGLESAGPDSAADLHAWGLVVGEWEDAQRPARAAALLLVQHPGDPDASLTVGRYLCFVKDDWGAGLPMLARGSDPTVRELAIEDLRSRFDAAPKLAAADGWRRVAAESTGLAAWRLRHHADSILRGLYPSVTGLRRFEVEAAMDSRPFFLFGERTDANDTWQSEHLRFWANHGREGPGSWAGVQHDGGRPMLVANRAGYVETIDHFPPEGTDSYRIEASLASDLLDGTALEFCGQRMYTTTDGIALANGWRPERRHPLDTGFHEYIIEGFPGRITFTVDGEPLGTMPVDEPGTGPLVLRGWEGHLRCRKLELWSASDASLTGYVRHTMQVHPGN